MLCFQDHFQLNRHFSLSDTHGRSRFSYRDRSWGVSGDVRQIPPVWNCLTKGWASLKILYNIKTCSIWKKNNCWFKWEKNLHKQRLIFLCRCTRHFYCFLILFRVTVIHKQCYRLLGINSHTHESGNHCINQSFLNFINYSLFFSLLFQGWETENRLIQFCS